MSSSRSLVLSAVSAAIIAIVLVSGVVAIGVLSTTRSTSVVTSSQLSGTTQSNSPPQTSVSQTTSASQNSVSTPETQSSSSSSGALAVLMTDPPTVPAGVTAVFITYSNLGIHVSGAGNNTGWHVLNLQGQIDLMSIINSTQTVARANITSGSFNALAFNVTSALVTFQGNNYTADLVYQNHLLFVPIVGGINVTGGQTSAAVIDISPTVLLLGNQTNPAFAFLPAATAYTVPAQSVQTLHLSVGDKDDLKNATWWMTFQKESKFEITHVSLSSSGFTFNVTNTGKEPVALKLVDVTSRTSISGGNVPLSNFPTLLSISEVFVLERNSTVIPITQVGNGIVEAQLDSAGFLVPVGHSQVFSFSGNVTLGAAVASVYKHAQEQRIVAGQTYILTITGNGLTAQAFVVAGS